MALSQSPKGGWAYLSPRKPGTDQSWGLQGVTFHPRGADAVVAGNYIFDVFSGPGAITRTVGSVVPAGVSTETLLMSIEALRQSIDGLKNEVSSLKDQFAAAIAQAAIKPRAISDEDAKVEIKQYFESLHGDTLYPSDVADDLNIDYDVVVRLIQELADDGQIAEA